MGFYEPVRWKIPALFGLLLLWGYLAAPWGVELATAVVLAAVALVGVVWFAMRRRRRLQAAERAAATPGDRA